MKLYLALEKLKKLAMQNNKPPESFLFYEASSETLGPGGSAKITFFPGLLKYGLSFLQ